MCLAKKIALSLQLFLNGNFCSVFLWDGNGSIILSLNVDDDDDDEINKANFHSISIGIGSFLKFSFHICLSGKFSTFCRSFHGFNCQKIRSISFESMNCACQKNGSGVFLPIFFDVHSVIQSLSQYRTNCDAKLDSLIENRNQSSHFLFHAKRKHVYRKDTRSNVIIFLTFLLPENVCVSACVSPRMLEVSTIPFKCVCVHASACGCFAKILNR